MRLALCGNPNVGKTTLFNRLTRSSAPVGNWHGVTVDVCEKRITGTSDTLVDLPGCYSLTARSKEEEITRDGILFGDYDVVLFVAEVNNLRRNLYLLTQVLEAGKKVVLIVNMLDEAKGKVDLALLERRLGVPVVGTSERMENPRRAVLEAAAKADSPSPPYTRDVAQTYANEARQKHITPAFAALKLVERDEYMAELLGVKNKCTCDTCADCERDMPARMRYHYIDGVLNGVIERRRHNSVTDKIDKIVLGKAALPIFFLIMTAVFVITFEAGRPLSELLTRLISLAAQPVKNADMPKWLCGFIGDGIIGGVGSILAFLPQVTLLFLLTTLLQDSGYMSRVAFVSDGFFKRFGLSGRAAFSLILGLGCSATAVLSTRGIAEKKARKRAAFVTPFVPCSARLSVFTAITAYFNLSALLVAAMYVIGFLAALVVLKIMRIAARNDGEEPLLMEMPPYRFPPVKRTFKAVLKSVAAFIVRVGSVVLGVSAIMWLLSNFSVRYGFTGGCDGSLMSTFAGLIAPVFKPLGFGDWRAVTALLSGVAAKETLVSVIASLGGMGEVFGSHAAAVSFLIFSCLYVPCVATLASLSKEIGFKGTLLSVTVHTAVAYLAAFAYYGTWSLAQVNAPLAIIIWACVGGAATVGFAVIGVRRAVKASRARTRTIRR
ncbi:MAG: ferrous iron transport protein B [Clostridiales bacterium]|nr:ferrous iron transport protein B [Clostridiales bacterium]